MFRHPSKDEAPTNRLSQIHLRLPHHRVRRHLACPWSSPADTSFDSFLIGLFTAIDKVEPFKQHFALQNYTLQYPYAVNERIPVFDLVIIACLAPAILITLYTLVVDGLFSHSKETVSVGRKRKWTGRYPLKDRLWELNCGILGLALAVAASFTVTGMRAQAVSQAVQQNICSNELRHI